MKQPIYLDNNATTPMDPRVLEAMLPYFTEHFGNAASRTHAYGWHAEAAVESAREAIARRIGADTKEIIFTSGATESNNLAIKGVAEAYRSVGEHIITVATEHNAVLDPCRTLERHGYNVTVLPVDTDGFIDLHMLRETITERTILVSAMYGNNEIGTLHDIAAIGALCRERGVLFHTDATQALGKVAFDVEAVNVDLASFTAHKVYGPKGCGALYVRRRNPRVRLLPQIDGGGHERGMRSGTLNVPGIVGFGVAVTLAIDEMETVADHTRQLRDRLWENLHSALDDITLNGPNPLAQPERRLPNNLNISFLGVESEALMMSARELAISSGSACTSASLQPSHVLGALDIGDERVRSAVRFGTGRFTTFEEVDQAAELLIGTVKKLRKLSPQSTTGM